MTKFRSLFGLCVVAGLSVAACAAPADAPEKTVSVKEGLTVIAADEAARRLVMDFRKDGRTIRFELLLGEEMEQKPEVIGAETPTFQVDARVTDANGAVFFMQRGGDTFLDASWKMDPVENIDLAGRVKDIKLPYDAVEALRALELPRSLLELKKSAIQIGLASETIGDKDGEPAATEPAPTVPTEEGPALGTKATTVYYSTVGKWDYRVRYMGVVGGFHSAVQLRGWTSGGTNVANWSACNHGACAHTMTVYCTMGGWRYDDGTHRRAFYSDTTTGGIYSNGACGTLWGLATGMHLCNADSVVERDSIYHNNNQTGSAICYSGSATAWTVPGCH